MELNRDVARRGIIGAAVFLLLATVAYIGLAFISTVVFSIFLYYAVRPLYRYLCRLGFPRRLGAFTALVSFGTPFLALIGYTAAIVVFEIENLLESNDIATEAQADITDELDIGSLSVQELQTQLSNVDALPSLETVADMLFDVTGTVSGLFLQLLIIIFAVYYMLVDGPQLVSWFVDTYDDDGLLRTYMTVVDSELSATLFGNIANIFVTGIIAIVSFLGFNLLVPSTIAVPFPVLAGILIGVGTLIPVIGIKLVYLPIVAGIGANAWLVDKPGLIVPVVGLLVFSAIVLDFIPDLFIRAQFSGEKTHSGLLMIAYIVGPSLFGFYGLFLLPILLILGINAITILVPYVLSGESQTPEQSTLSEFS
ncbi:AI-2E family transporter [Halovenus rubra]|uniref:AI-2E family transporter n=2 Tax=Halovenus rubra TaxID=869890 RepID=A0ABD5X8W3_9EURY|nr:AI-2E family transporter [Halovenus rubra]